MINRLQKNIRHITNLFVLCLLSFILVCSCKIETSSPTVITGIKITSLPEKTVYYVGERIDYTGLNVTATYSDGSEKEIMDYTISLEAGTTLTKEGKHAVEIKYNGFSQTFSIEVLPVITGIKILSLPKKTIYYVNEKIDFDGLKVSAIYSDGKENEIVDYKLSLTTGTVLTKEKTYSIEVQYEGFSQTFYIEVLPVITEIKISSLPEKTVYYVSESIDYTGLQVISVYSDGHEEEITDYTLSLEEGTVLAKEQTLTVNIQFNGFSTAFDIEIRPNQVSVVQVTLPEHFDVENLLSYNEANKTFIAKTGFASYTWWLDSEKLSNQTSSYTLNIANLSSGYHSLMIVVKSSDYERYSATATINIMREER